MPKAVIAGPKKKYGYVYLLRSQSTGWSKIGESTDPERRLAELRREYPELNWNLVTAIRTNDCQTLEAAFHRLFWKERKRVVGDTREWFMLEASQIEFVETLASTLRVSSADRPPLYEVADDGWIQILRELEKMRPHAAFAYREALYGSPNLQAEGQWIVVFPRSRDDWLWFAKDYGEEALLDAAERVTGERPRSIRYIVKELL